MLPCDGHVHSEWSWDAPEGSMERGCAHAVRLGLPSVAFTDHADFTPWVLPAGSRIPAAWHPLVRDGVLTPPPLDVDGYRRCLRRCRERFPGLRVRSGVELSEPHRYPRRSAELLRRGRFDRVLAGVHSVPVAAGFSEVSDGFRDSAPDRVLRDHLAETVRMIRRFDGFEVLAHLDYPVRYWPDTARSFDPYDFQDDYRQVLRALADGDRVLEVNTRIRPRPAVLTWWRQEGGRAIAFGGDAHRPGEIARGFAEAAAMARAAGFRPGSDPLDFWITG